MTIKVDKVLDAKGLACPMPIVRSKKALEELNAGQVLELQSTDKGSLDIRSWAKTTGHQYLGSNQEDDIYIICRTGNRSDMAAQLMTEHGFTHIKNVVPGMSKWNVVIKTILT